MRKLIYILSAVSVVFIAGCLKSGTQTPGPAGTAGAAGAPGGDLPAFNIPFTLNSLTMGYGSGNLFWGYQSFVGYNPKYQYMLEVTVGRASTPPAKEQYTLPVFNVYTPADEIYATIGHDSIKIWYYSPTATPWPDTAEMAANIVVIPKDTIVR
jgi:hypothetical protein